MSTVDIKSKSLSSADNETHVHNCHVDNNVYKFVSAVIIYVRNSYVTLLGRIHPTHSVFIT